MTFHKVDTDLSTQMEVMFTEANGWSEHHFQGVDNSANIDLRQKCIHLRHNLFAPILLLRHLFVQAMDIICANKIDIHLRHCYRFIVLL